MSFQQRPYLSLALALTFAACGDDGEPEQGTSIDNVFADSGAIPVTDAAVIPPWDGSFPTVDAGADAAAQDAASSDTGVAQGDARVDTDAGPVSMGDGDCCPDGNCLCHGPDPAALTSSKGPYNTAELKLPLGTVTYPTDAKPPLASIALCGGFLNTGPEMAAWAPFYASHGIVTIITTTGAGDLPDQRADELLAALEQLKAEQTKSGSPLNGKLDLTRVGTSGYSMGGGGTTLASVKKPTIKTSVGLAPWGPATSGIKVPTLLLCGGSDTTAPCSTATSAYNGIAAPTPKMMVSIDGSTHFSWFGPTDAGMGISGKYALAFQKVYLEGDTRWEDVLKTKLSGSTQTTNIK
jgi:dienelactone hydrolase